MDLEALHPSCSRGRASCPGHRPRHTAPTAAPPAPPISSPSAPPTSVSPAPPTSATPAPPTSSPPAACDPPCSSSFLPSLLIRPIHLSHHPPSPHSYPQLSAVTHCLTPPFASTNHSAETHKSPVLKIVISPSPQLSLKLHFNQSSLDS